MVLSHPRPVVQSVGTQKRPGLGPKWMFIGVKLRNLGRLCSCDVCICVCVCVEMQLAQAPPLRLTIHTLVSSAASGFWRDLPPLGVFARHQPVFLWCCCFVATWTVRLSAMQIYFHFFFK